MRPAPTVVHTMLGLKTVGGKELLGSRLNATIYNWAAVFQAMEYSLGVLNQSDKLKHNLIFTPLS